MLRQRKRFGSSSAILAEDPGRPPQQTMEDDESSEKLTQPRTIGATRALLIQIRCPTINKAYIQQRLKLPEQFLGACTLKEGTFVTILILQSVAVTFTAYLSVYVTFWKSYGDGVWLRKFKADFDPYITGWEGKETIDYYAPLWDEMALALIITHSAYFVTGLGVCYGLCYNHCHPWVYLPWLVMTGFLVVTAYVTWFCMLIGLFVLGSRREISITWDVVPMVCVILYAMAWTYGFRIVAAHYQRRCIVRFWRKNKRKEFFDVQ